MYWIASHTLYSCHLNTQIELQMCLETDQSQCASERRKWIAFQNQEPICQWNILIDHRLIFVHLQHVPAVETQHTSFSLE